ncbi:MAG: ATP-dependent DNA helicase RecG [Actinomycetia bacterium]|nr:ATP-dependent DNA helicase RecG [Actinomycetes bacterium]
MNKCEINLDRIDEIRKLPKGNNCLNTLNLQSPVSKVPGVGNKVETYLQKLNIFTIEGLLTHFPSRYLDRRKLKEIKDLKMGEEVTVVGKVKVVKKKFIKKRKLQILEVGIFDGTGYLYGIWFNQNFIAKIFKDDTEIAFSGKVKYKYGQLQIENPLYDIITEGNEDDEIKCHTARIIPIHPATASLTPNRIRRIIFNLIPQAEVIDFLPSGLISKYNLYPRNIALKEIHYPGDEESLLKAKQRLIFEELFLIQTALALRKKRIENEENGIVHQTKGELIDKFFKSLPYELTGDQNIAVKQIFKDMKNNSPMNRLLQGEVGCGKTVVAVAAMVAAVQGGYQVAIMAPTEILANQHLKKISMYLKNTKITVNILLGSTTLKDKKEIKARIKKGNIDVVIGTHALIQEDVEFKKLGLAVIDEQHRFGLRQRINMKEKGYNPDVLIMTATPIPRTLSLTLYGDLDVSIIKELPKGRNIADKIKTMVCKRGENKNAYQTIRQEVSNGRQAFIICPLIEETDKIEAKSVLKEVEYIKKDIFPDLRVGVLHGKMKPKEKDEIMEKFYSQNIDILISTIVVEVGIDVPNATVMVIENADRFGLSQLHQLRGRVGRGKHNSYCYMFADSKTEEAQKRMEAIQKISDGFLLSEEDLKIRVEGEIFGLKQSGLTDLKISKLVRDFETLITVRAEAFKLIESDPLLKQPNHILMMDKIEEKFTDNIEWLFHS